MTAYDDAATVNDGSIASGVSGTPAANLKGNDRATFLRRSMLDGRKLKPKDSSSLLALIAAMGPSTLYVPFANQQINDLRSGDMGPRGMYTVLVLNTFLDGLEKLSGANLKDPELLEHAVGQARDLMRQFQMSPEDIAHHMELLERRLEAA